MTKRISNAPEPFRPVGSGRSYHKPPAITPADYETWCKADLWTIERGILLLLGAEYIPYGEYGERAFYKAYQDDFNKKLEIALGSVKVGKLNTLGGGLFAFHFSEVSPSDFILWARSKGYSIPAELEAINSVTQAETMGNDGADTTKQEKKLIPKERNTTELLDLIYQMFDNLNIHIDDNLSKLTAKKAWGLIIAGKYKNDLIKQVTGTRKTASIELNGGDNVDYTTFSRTYNRRFE